jgi:LmbE family N-acetylglucosaminyl deacetylase
MTNTSVARLRNAYTAPRSTELWRALAPLKSVVSFMNTGAHPDDETSRMLAAITFRDGINLSHACSTRGEGGQNAIGPHSGVSLGVLRTREMERAAEVLKMKQYWLCQYEGDPLADFGFSKSGEETLKIWGEERTLERFVFIIRSERPDIIAPTFLDVPGQHGHHRAMTQSAFKAVKLAADPQAFPEQNLRPWQVKKLYLPAWSGAGDAYDDDLPPPPETVRIDGNGIDDVFGMSYAQIGEVSRSFHQTQGMGNWVERDQDFQWPLNLAWAAEGFDQIEESITDNLPRTLRELAPFAHAPVIHGTLCKAQDYIDGAIIAWPNRQKVADNAALALSNLRKAKDNCPKDAQDEILHRLDEKEQQLSKVIFLALDIDARLELSVEEARPAQSISASLTTTGNIEVRGTLYVPEEWHIKQEDEKRYLIDVADSAAPSDPLPDEWFPLRANSLVYAKLQFNWHGVEISHEIAPERRLNIVPQHEYRIEHQALIFNRRHPQPQKIELIGDLADKDIDLVLTDDFDVKISDKSIDILPSENLVAGKHVAPVVIDNKKAMHVERMQFEHTGRITIARELSVDILTLDVQFTDEAIGYIAGGSDVTDVWLRKMGMNIVPISDEEIARGQFAKYKTILVGVFAFRTRPLLSDNLSAVHQWVREGGNLVTLYHRPWDNWDPQKTALAPLTIGKPSLRWRVTDQNADVSVLDAHHPLLNSPNKITIKDWQGWHKERGLYFASAWDDQYHPLLAMSDEGEAPLKGALLSGTFGKGRHTHTSLILHHQLTKLVPGAFRLLANLLHPCK